MLFSNHTERKEPRVSATDVAPTYFIDKPSEISAAVEEGIALGIKYLGGGTQGFGPVWVHVADKSSGVGKAAWAKCIPVGCDDYMEMILSGQENAFGSGWADDASAIGCSSTGVLSWGRASGAADCNCGHMNLMLYNQSTHPTPVVAKTIALHE